MKWSQILKIEFMEPIVIKRILLAIICCMMSLSRLQGQTTSDVHKRYSRAFTFKKSKDPFFYFGNKIRRGESHCYETLENDLVAGVPIPADILCRNNYGIFAFKVNREGKIEKVEYSGDLDSSIVRKIKLNIRQTDGKYVKPTNSKKESFHWFVLSFVSNGSRLNSYKCPNAIKLEMEYDLEFKRSRSYLNIIEFLPDFPSLTVLHNMDHLREMIKTGLLEGDRM